MKANLEVGNMTGIVFLAGLVVVMQSVYFSEGLQCYQCTSAYSLKNQAQVDPAGTDSCRGLGTAASVVTCKPDEDRCFATASNQYVETTNSYIENVERRCSKSSEIPFQPGCQSKTVHELKDMFGPGNSAANSPPEDLNMLVHICICSSNYCNKQDMKAISRTSSNSGPGISTNQFGAASHGLSPPESRPGNGPGQTFLGLFNGTTKCTTRNSLLLIVAVAMSVLQFL